MAYASCYHKHSMLLKRSSHLLCVSVLLLVYNVVVVVDASAAATADKEVNKVTPFNIWNDSNHRLYVNVMQEFKTKKNVSHLASSMEMEDFESVCTGSNCSDHNRSISSSLQSSGGMPFQRHLLSRNRRYLSFPEGSSFSVAVCFTVGIIGNPRFNYMSFGLNWGVAYDLPNTTWILNHLHGFAKTPVAAATWHRRSRRYLYGEIERVVDNMGYNGRDCILRALCESRQYFQNTKMGMIGEMLRAIFSLPKQRLYTREVNEDPDIAMYDTAYRKARSLGTDCSSQYNCNFSLLELAFGKYSTPPEGYYEEH